MTKTILITGCSSGIGLAAAVALARDYHVIATMRDLSKRGDLDTALSAAGVLADIQQLDVCDVSSVSRVVAQLDRIDVLINNAGIAIAGFFEETSPVHVDEQFAPNVMGAMALARAVLPKMRAQRSGRIIMISSVAGLTGTPGLSLYNASKWAIEGFSEGLRLELTHFGISVHLVEPGPFKTKIFSDNGQFHSTGISDYVSLVGIFKRRLESMINRLTVGPEPVVAVIERMIRTKMPPFRCVVGRMAKCRVLARRFLPFSWYEAIVKRMMFGVK